MKILFINPYTQSCVFLERDQISHNDLCHLLNTLTIQAVVKFECDASLYVDLNASKPTRSKGFIFNNKHYYSFGVIVSHSNQDIPENYKKYFSFFSTECEILDE